MPSASTMSRRNGLTALAHSRRTRSSVSLLLSVVRSIRQTARSSHAAWLSPLMLRRLVSDATRRSSALRLTLRIDSRKPRSSAMPGLRAMPWPAAGTFAATREGSAVTVVRPASATACCVLAIISLVSEGPSLGGTFVRFRIGAGSDDCQSGLISVPPALFATSAIGESGDEGAPRPVYGERMPAGR